jgi:hypothetical protein
MISGMVPVRYSLALRTAACILGVDIEFGKTDSRNKFQRIDVLSDEFGARDILRRYKVIVGGVIVGKEYQEADAQMLRRPKLESSKATD